IKHGRDMEERKWEEMGTLLHAPLAYPFV
ncbi:MAG: hypothetical protein QOG89_3813, partial [Thermomicrobiales bacterium]|nr:hypothetical protein [Thermomicrobiales bacterium]